jgi:broad specificity phosphatase PhoE
MTKFILVRHGVTDWNVAGRYQGHADPPLNTLGRRQAQALAEQLAGQPLKAIYSSDLQRALDTAQAVAARHGLTVTVEPRLPEVNQGEWEGMLHADILAGYPEEWAARETDPLHSRSPGGESVAEVAARTWAAADDIARAHPAGPVLVVSHGLALACLLCKAHCLPVLEARKHIPENATPLEITWKVVET